MDSNKAVQLYTEAIDAVEHRDSAPAFRIYRVWDEMIASLPQEYTNDREIQSDLPAFKSDLRHVSFPELPLTEAQQLLSSEALRCVQSGIDLGDMLSTRYTFLSYGTQEKERQALRDAFLKNTEKIGPNTIGEWASIFDRLIKPEARDEKSLSEFLIREPRVASLTKAEQGLLSIVLKIYDEYLATELLSIFDLAVMSKGSSDPTGVTRSQDSSQTAIAHMPLLQALSKYENLGNQLITNERIKIKSQPEPVRPSLLYWIKYYRDELGIGHHSTVDRGNFLFRSENGKRLSPEERERVNLVLKSVEENYPVDIDTDHSEIIFPAFVASAPRPQPVPQAVSQTAPVATPVPRPKPAFNFGQGGMMSGTEVKSAPKDAPAPGNLSFTSKHVFPAEKSATLVAPIPTPRPVVQSPQPQSNPFRINPVSLGKVKDEE